MTNSQTKTNNDHAANVEVLQSDLRLATGYYFHFLLGHPTLPDWYDHQNGDHIAKMIKVTDAIGTLATYYQFLEAGGDLESARGQQVTEMLDTAYRGWNASEYTSMPFQEFLAKLEQGDVKGVMDTDLVEAAAAIDYVEQVQGICGYARDPDTLPGKAL
ncbi:hypothetical protein [Shewanella algae]|uniref:hypothetical protein n=1 Tax=Shewanella algae TaxID=38313 RepID=UPI00165643CA|nr:hypothetical protein [Shewanella algae]MBC8798491.1 hypothetical protein [Shewanella algae]